MFLVLRVLPLPWDLGIYSGYPVSLRAAGDGIVGYLPVFEDRGLADAWAQEHTDGPAQPGLRQLWLPAADSVVALGAG